MDKQCMQAVMDLSTPIHYLLSDLEQHSYSYQEVIIEIEQHLASYKKSLYDLGLMANQVDVIVYATAAMADEIVMRSTWSNKTAWARQPLCVRLFGDAHAGMNFFKKIRTLSERPVTNALPLWYYWRCIQLGFEGQYRNTNGQEIKSILMMLELGLKEAGFVAGKQQTITNFSQPDSGIFRIAWPIHRYIVIATFLCSLLVFAAYNFIFYQDINHLYEFIQTNAVYLQNKSKFITP